MAPKHSSACLQHARRTHALTYSSAADPVGAFEPFVDLLDPVGALAVLNFDRDFLADNSCP